jgi:hypothetical protein
MKMYVCDKQWEGAIIIIAHNVDEAVEKATLAKLQVRRGEFVEYEITDGLVINTDGDNF